MMQVIFSMLTFNQLKAHKFFDATGFPIMMLHLTSPAAAILSSSFLSCRSCLALCTGKPDVLSQASEAPKNDKEGNAVSKMRYLMACMRSSPQMKVCRECLRPAAGATWAVRAPMKAGSFHYGFLAWHTTCTLL